MHQHWFNHTDSELTHLRNEIDKLLWIFRYTVIWPRDVLHLGNESFFFGLKKYNFCIV
jgi:hypothetical protein